MSRIGVLLVLSMAFSLSAVAVEDMSFIINSGNRYIKEVESSTQHGESAIHEFRNFVGHGLLHSYGIDDLSGQSVTWSEPLPVFFVRTDKVAAYEASFAPERAVTLLEDERTVLLILSADAKPVSTVSMRKTAGQWMVARFGSPHRAVLIRTVNASVPKRPTEQIRILVEIPGLEASFIGIVEANQLLLVPLKSSVRLALEEGAVLPAHETFIRLSKIAKETHPAR